MSSPGFSGDNAVHILENIQKIDVSDIMEIQAEEELLSNSLQSSGDGEQLTCRNVIDTVDMMVAGLKWTRDAVACLLEYIKEYQQQLNDKKLRKSTVWEAIAQRLCDSGFKVNGAQCDQKWRNMNKRYKEYLKDLSMGRINKNSKHKRLEFVEDLEQLLGDKFVLEDINVTEYEIEEQDIEEKNIMILPCNNSDEDEDETVVDPEQDQSFAIINPSTSNQTSFVKSNKRKKESNMNTVLDLIKSSVENQTKAIYALIEHNKRQSQLLIEMLRKQHQDDMKWKRQILDVLDKDLKLKENVKKRKT